MVHPFHPLTFSLTLLFYIFGAFSCLFLLYCLIPWAGGRCTGLWVGVRDTASTLCCVTVRQGGLGACSPLSGLHACPHPKALQRTLPPPGTVHAAPLASSGIYPPRGRYSRSSDFPSSKQVSAVRQCPAHPAVLCLTRRPCSVGLGLGFLEGAVSVGPHSVTPSSRTPACILWPAP